MAYCIIIRTLIVLSSPYFGCTVNQCSIVYVSSSIPHYIIWTDKSYLLVHIIVEIHLLEISMNCRGVHQPPPNPPLELMMNSCFRTSFHGSFPENLTMSYRQFVSHLFLLRHPKSEVSWHQSDLNLGQIWWLEHFSRVTTLVFIWPGRVMTCLAHLAGGPIVISFPF